MPKIKSIPLSLSEISTLIHLSRPEVYSCELPKDLRESLVSKGLVEWLPSPAWTGENQFGITEAGKRFLDKHEIPSSVSLSISPKD